MIFFFNVRKQPFYVPFDPTAQGFDIPLPTYEDTVLFIISNFQYLVCCVAFSISKPYRRPLYTNRPYLISLLVLFILDTLLLWLPGGNAVSSWFDVLAFKSDGHEYISYKAWISLAIVVNSILTYGAEKLIVEKVTKAKDRQVLKDKQAKFDKEMT